MAAEDDPDLDLEQAPADQQAQWMARAQQGDRVAYGQLVQTYQDRLYNAILRIIGDREEARDLTQEVFSRALEKIDGFRGECAPYTWFFKIAVNLSISQLRKLQRRRTFSLDAGDAPSTREDQAAGLARRVGRTSDDPVHQAQHNEAQQQVLSALGRLDAEYRAILVMRDIEALDYQQMADILSLPLGTLKSRLFRARLALRDELDAYMNGE